VRNSIKLLGTLGIALLAVRSSQAQVYLPTSAGNFSGFANGDLAGQNGWTAVTTTPTGVQVVGGIATFQGGLSSDMPDARYNFSSTVPSTAGTSFYLGAAFRVTSIDQASPGLSPIMSGQTTTGQVGPVLGVSAGSGAPGSFRFIARGGPSNSPNGITYALDSVNRPIGQTIRVVLAYDFVAGASNDVLRLYVNPTSPNRSDNTPAFTLTNFVSSGQDFSWQEFTGLTGVSLTPQGSFSSTSPGVEFDRLSASGDFTTLYNALPVPEPTALAAVVVPVTWGIVRARRPRVTAPSGSAHQTA